MEVILGEAALSDIDRVFYRFAEAFEKEYIQQDEYESRTIDETLDLGWKLLAMVPTSELKRIRTEYLEEFLPKFLGQQSEEEAAD